MTMQEQLTEIFREVFDDDEITLTPEMTADDVDGWDSLSHVNLIVTIETRFNIKFNQKELLTFKNVGDLMASIERLAGTMEPDALRALGLDLGLPLSIASNPNYPPPTMGEGAAPGGGAQPGALQLPGPSTPGASPAVTLESVAPGPRS